MERRLGAMSVAVLALGLVAPARAAPQGSAQPLVVNVTGHNGVGTITSPGRPCADGGAGHYRTYGIDGSLAPGVLSQLAGTVRGTFSVHHDALEPPASGIAAGVPGGPPVLVRPVGAFLLAAESHITMTNYRGAVQLALSGGDCTSANTPISFSPDGHIVSAGPFTGTFTVNPDPSTTNGAYRAASGSGTYTVTVGEAPGGLNAWSLGLNGSISVLEPALSAKVVSTFWGNLGLDYVSRIVSVTYQVTNTGAGDAFGVVLSSATSSTSGVTGRGPQPQALGDLPAGQSTNVTVTYKLGLASPCQDVILHCSFTTVIGVSLPDALDVAAVSSATLSATAPALPPPL